MVMITQTWERREAPKKLGPTQAHSPNRNKMRTQHKYKIHVNAVPTKDSGNNLLSLLYLGKYNKHV